MPNFYVGIDVSKFKHTCCIISDQGEVIQKSFDFSNSKEGFTSLLNALKLIAEPHRFQIVMEATGHYHEALFRYLLANEFQAQIKNPVVISRFKDSEFVDKAKTDKLDALLIANYALRHSFTPSLLKSYNILRIQKLARAKYYLYQDRMRVINHLHRYLDESFPEFVKFFKERDDKVKRYQGRNFFDSPTILWLLLNFPSAKKFANARIETSEKLRRMSKGSFSLVKFNKLREVAKNSIGVSFLETEIIIVQLVKDLISVDENNEELDRCLEPLIDEFAPQLLTIPGIGYRLAGLFISEIGDATQFSTPDKLIKFAGLDVRVYQSGTVEKRGGIRKRGSPLLRYALFQAAEKARIHCPELAEYYSKKKSEGKHWICALTHTARKILRTVWALLTTGQSYNPNSIH